MSAGQRLADALRTFRAFEMRTELLGCLDDCAALAYFSGRARDAAIIAAAAAASRKRLSLVQSQRAAARTQELASAIADDLGADHLTCVAGEAQSMEIDDVINVALGAFFLAIRRGRRIDVMPILRRNAARSLPSLPV